MRVARASKPRSAIVAAPTAVFVPFSLFETGTPLAFAIGRLRRNSSVLRSPDFVIDSRLKFRTGLGPTSSAVGMFEPVTMMRSVVVSVLPALAAGAGAFGAGTPGAGVVDRWAVDVAASAAAAFGLPTASCALALDPITRSVVTPTARAVWKNPDFGHPVLIISLVRLQKGLMKGFEAFKIFFQFF